MSKPSDSDVGSAHTRQDLQTLAQRAMLIVRPWCENVQPLSRVSHLDPVNGIYGGGRKNGYTEKPVRQSVKSIAFLEAAASLSMAPTFR